VEEPGNGLESLPFDPALHGDFRKIRKGVGGQIDIAVGALALAHMVTGRGQLRLQPGWLNQQGSKKYKRAANSPKSLERRLPGDGSASDDATPVPESRLLNHYA